MSNGVKAREAFPKHPKNEAKWKRWSIFLHYLLGKLSLVCLTWFFVELPVAIGPGDVEDTWAALTILMKRTILPIFRTLIARVLGT